MARLGPNLALNNEFVAGFLFGVERTVSTVTTQSDSVYGLKVLWLPSERTDVAASVDRRFFGNGFNVSMRHRSPFYSMALRAIREPIFPGTAGVGARGNLASYLDSILTTRFPDATQRGAMVDEMVATRGLQTDLQGTAGYAGDYAQLGSGGEATLVLLGTRNVFTLSVYQQSIRPLTRSDGSAVFVGLGGGDNRQRGATFGFNRRLAPDTSFDFSVQGSRVEGLASRLGDLSREFNYRLAFGRNFTPRTLVSVGAGLRKFDTNVSGLPSFEEALGFATLSHRF
jgi:uncharacterized protein (PEP-CTERM system associated)